MNITFYGIFILLALFVILLVSNPNISCFGKRLKSPFYPLMRKKSRKRIQAQDYGFDLGGRTNARQRARPDGGRGNRAPGLKSRSGRGTVAEDYGFDLGGSKKTPDPEEERDRG